MNTGSGSPAPNRVCTLVQMGTRLLASADSPVHGNLKQAVVRADETSTVLLPLDGKRMMRVIRTPAAEKIETSTSFGEGGASLQRVQRLYFDGDMDASVANTGQVTGRIEDLPPAADIIKQMWTGCREVPAAAANRIGPIDNGGAGA